MYFSRRLRGPDNVLQLNNLMYLGVIFDKGMTWNHNIKRTVTKALSTSIRTCSLFKYECLDTNIKLTLYKAVIRSVITYAWPPASMCRTLSS
jgi:hypothetical protein